MTRPEIKAAAAALVEARRDHRKIVALPEAVRPSTVAEAHAIQDAVTAALGEAVAGWKMGFTDTREVMRGVILGSRLLPSPATVRAADMPLLGIEAEIAFLFERELPPRERPYGADEVAEAVTALVGIEIVDSRFADYRGTPLLDRTADFMSNGAFVAGQSRSDWRSFDLTSIEAELRVNGRTVVARAGGHPTRDPILPALALVDLLRTQGGVPRGMIMTTGTYTGLHFAEVGDDIVASFKDFGRAELHIDK